jgi:hypothetical protein
MVGLFEWVDRIQAYDQDGWNYIDELKAFVDGGYTDFDFVDHVSSILNLGCHSPPCTGISPTATEAHNQRDRNDVFQRFLNQLRVVYNFPAPPPPTPMPTPYPTEEPSIHVSPSPPAFYHPYSLLSSFFFTCSYSARNEIGAHNRFSHRAAAANRNSNNISCSNFSRR